MNEPGVREETAMRFKVNGSAGMPDTAPSGRSPAPKRCWPTCRATRTASRSPTAACSRWTSVASPCAGRPIASRGGAKGKTRYKAMTLAPEEFMRRFLLHVLLGAGARVVGRTQSSAGTG